MRTIAEYELLEWALEQVGDWVSLVEGDELLGLLNSIFCGDAELLVELRGRSGGSEGGHADRGVSVARPSHDGASFDGEHGHALGEYGFLVFLGLLLEEFPGGEGDDANVDSLSGESGSSLDSNLYLRASGGEDHVGGRGCIGEDVGTLEGTLEGGTDVLGQILARERQQSGSVRVANGRNVSRGSLDTIGGANEEHVGRGAAQHELLNGLMGGSIFTQTDRVVRENVQRVQA